MKKIVIFGLGQIAELTFDLAQQIDDIKVEAFTAHKKHIISNQFLNLPVYTLHQQRRTLITLNFSISIYVCKEDCSEFKSVYE